jgi:hypothetical protein
MCAPTVIILSMRLQHDQVKTSLMLRWYGAHQQWSHMRDLTCAANKAPACHLEDYRPTSCQTCAPTSIWPDICSESAHLRSHKVERGTWEMGWQSIILQWKWELLIDCLFRTFASTFGQSRRQVLWPCILHIRLLSSWYWLSGQPPNKVLTWHHEYHASTPVNLRNQSLKLGRSW